MSNFYPGTPAFFFASLPLYGAQDGVAPVRTIHVNEDGSAFSDSPLGRVFDLTLSGDATLTCSADTRDGFGVLWRVHAVGGDRTLTLGSGINWIGSSAGAITVLSGTTVLICGIWRLAASVWDATVFGAFSPGGYAYVTPFLRYTTTNPPEEQTLQGGGWITVRIVS